MATHLEEKFATAWTSAFPHLPFEREVVIAPWEAWAQERKLLGLASRKIPFRGDFAWPLAQVIVEVQGGTWKAGGHSSGSGIEKDCQKTVVAQLAGWVVLPMTKQMVTNAKQQTIWLPRIAELIEARMAERTDGGPE